jgi:chromosome partitioning protein
MGPEWWSNWSKHREKTSYQIFLDVIMGSHAWSIQNSTTVLQECGSLYLCPATFDMLDLDNRLHYELQKPSHPKPFQCLDIIIKPICSQFDYVILDCPPNMYMTTMNALFCADHIIIPTVPDFLSTAGLKRLVGRLKDLREQYLLFDTEPARIAGIVYNMFNNNRKRTMDGVIEDVESYVVEQKQENRIFSKEAFSSRVRYLNAVSESQERSMPVTLAFPSSEAAKDIIALAKKLEEVT